MTRKPAVRVLKDGREICNDTAAGRREYARRRAERWNFDHGICCLCGVPVNWERATTEHPSGRGLGGGKRDDRVENIRVAHLLGNAAKGSMSFEKYVELPLQKRIENCLGLAKPRRME